MKKCALSRFTVASRLAALAGASLLWLLPSVLLAQLDPIEIHRTETRSIKIHHQLQKNEEEWAVQKAEMLNRLRTLKSEEKSLEKVLAGHELQLTAVQKQQAGVERQAIESTRIRDNLENHLEAIIVRLNKQMADDLPFLQDERTTRIESIKADLVHPEISLAEKCRRVMEALKIEVEYGHTVEVYQQPIRINGREDAPPLMADVLRVGRLALFWRTPDGKGVGQWDRAAAQWQVLPDRYRRHINDAAKMALKRRTVEMVKLPLGRIVPQ